MGFKAVRKEHPTPSSPTHLHFPSKGSLWGVKVQEGGQERHSLHHQEQCSHQQEHGTNEQDPNQ